MWKRLVLICTLGAMAGIFMISLNPVNSKLLNLAFLGCVAGAWIGFAILTWNRKTLRVLTLVLALLAVTPLMLPAGNIDEAELRQDYVRRMGGFEGTKYFWGGESPRGIDCSGLPRRALRDALLAYGVRHLNGRAFRASVEQWWFDASAKALGEGFRDYTIPIGTTGIIREMSYEKLLPGDLAVTTCGVHVMAYAGDGRWIQADPGIGVVATLNGRMDENDWFNVPVTPHRWSVLTSGAK
jgi:cell wall-associated NlpC family hydrolase